MKIRYAKEADNNSRPDKTHKSDFAKFLYFIALLRTENQETGTAS